MRDRLRRLCRDERGQFIYRVGAGAFTHGGSFTVTGSGFGTKSTAAPLKYDDFQSVTLGSGISTSSAAGPSWTPGGTFVPVASNTRLRSNTPFTRNMRSHWQAGAGGADESASNVILLGQTITRLYLDAWLYYDISGGGDGGNMNVKIFRIHTTNTGSPNAYNQVYSSGTSGVAFARDGIDYTGSSLGYWESTGGSGPLYGSDFQGHWMHAQWMMDAGSGNNAIDGTAIARFRNDAGTQQTFSQVGNIAMTGAGQTSWQEIYIGNYVRTGDFTGDIYFFWESVYLDTSFARVEIGDNATYTSCTHREIQIPSAWSSTSVTFTVNRGSFTVGSTVHIFVTDSSNTTQHVTSAVVA